MDDGGAQCYFRRMADERLEITLKLSPDVARRLTAWAAREGITIEALATRLLEHALTPDVFAPGVFEARLDAIPGYYERLQESIAQGEAGKTIPLSELGQ